MFHFIENIGDYFSGNYFSEEFPAKVIAKSGHGEEALALFAKNIAPLKERYYRYKRDYLDAARPKDRIAHTHKWHGEVLRVLGYEHDKTQYAELFLLDNKKDKGVPVRLTLHRGDQPHLFVMEMQSMIRLNSDEEPPGIFEQVYNRQQWEPVFTVPEGFHLTPSVINEAISAIFLLDKTERPEYVLMLGGSEVYLLHFEKWMRGSYLRFRLEDLFEEATRHRNYYSLFYLLLSKEGLAPDADLLLLEQLDEDSHKSAYAVTKDLKAGIIHAVEALANEAVYYLHHSSASVDPSADKPSTVIDAAALKDDCLTVVYRLLFLFYAESRPELGILPDEDAYRRGYSLELLRDLEQTPLNSESSRNGYFFHETLSALFRLLREGYRPKDADNNSFSIQPLDSPLFDDDELKYLSGVRFRNHVWQDIVCSLSLSQKQKGKARGRISYANLGVNQLGSVYEGLLAYRGFFAEEDLIEVHKDGKPEEGTFVTPRRRMDEFKPGEILRDDQGRPVILPKGAFIYRLSGRDRQQSASYYTPESLTQTTVKYTLKPILERLKAPRGKDKLSADDLLKLRILEPAQGASAFQNEVVNQLAEAYLEAKQQETGKRINPGEYQDQRQRVKAWIATANVYGVDLNPTAIELGKLSLWLNVIHRDMEPPFFGYRLAAGNAVVGAWLRAYRWNDLKFTPLNSAGTKYEKREWWLSPPERIRWKADGTLHRADDQIYHFLLPDPGMAAASGDKMLREQYPGETKAMSEWRKTFCQPIKAHEYPLLQKLCRRVDELLDEHYLAQTLINEYTNPPKHFFGQDIPAQTALSIGYEEKDEIARKRAGLNAPFFKLKTTLDYWCALWFWRPEHAKDLPTREQWYADIARILELDLMETDEHTHPYSGTGVGADLFGAPQPVQAKLFQEPRQLALGEYRGKKKKDVTLDLIRKYTDAQTAGDALRESPRLARVQAYAREQRFFHPEVEFVEVFRERGGFDIIVGNPPWLKLEFEESALLAERSPELAIRNTSAPEIAKKRGGYLSDEQQRDAYLAELAHAAATGAFLNAVQNYPLLVGQQTNLYKCVLENAFLLVGERGFVGLLHPITVFDDPKGQPLRREIYPRLKFLFSFWNSLLLFSEVHDQMKFGINVYSGLKQKCDFTSLHNLFHPATIDGCFVHNGQGICGGIKSENEQSGEITWNTKPHADRKVKFTEEQLKILAKTFEDSDDWRVTKLVSIHNWRILSVLEKLGSFEGSVKNAQIVFSECWHETNDVNAGNIKRVTKYPEFENSEMIYSGPHIYVGNPLFKTPIEKCVLRTDYDPIELNDESTGDDFLPRTNYVPGIELVKFKENYRGFQIDSDEQGNPVYDRWIDYYKLTCRNMLNQPGERTLIPAILPPDVSHINGVTSVIFTTKRHLVESAGIVSSLVMDFFIKTVGKSNLNDETIQHFPLGIPARFQAPVYARTLLLNCLNKYYAPLWEEMWDDEWRDLSWSRDDARLRPFDTLTPVWERNTPLRNAFERRQALVELDVLVAMALGLSLDELILLYTVQFPVLQQNEDDTWYDRRGNIIFTCSKGLTGVGLDRPRWEQVRNTPPGSTVEHTIEKSELYRGKKVVYEAPFEKCDRVEDYGRAWGWFEGRL